jgi:predicted RNase H-like nuclease (RuvC/YqgF family)
VHYIRDLKQEANSQSDCDQQLITRLMDLIRPAYSNDQKKMIELDAVMQEIGSLHDKRYIEQKEKTEQLRTEICQLQKMLITVPTEPSICNENNNSNYSMANTMNRTRKNYSFVL